MTKQKFKLKLAKTEITKEDPLTKIFEEARKRIKKEKEELKRVASEGYKK